MRKSLKRTGTVSPFGLNQKTFENEDDQDQRRVNWNDPVEIKRRESNPKNSGSIDPLILDIDEKPLLAIRVGIISTTTQQQPENQFGTPCPECKSIKAVVQDGCVHCEAIFSDSGEEQSLVADEVVDVTRKQNRTRTTTIPNIGKNGHTRQTSPHITNKGWKPSMPVVQNVMKISSTEARFDDDELQRKLKESGLKKMRKNTIAKISELERRKSERVIVSKLKCKL